MIYVKESYSQYDQESKAFGVSEKGISDPASGETIENICGCYCIPVASK